MSDAVYSVQILVVAASAKEAWSMEAFLRDRYGIAQENISDELPIARWNSPNLRIDGKVCTLIVKGGISLMDDDELFSAIYCSLFDVIVLVSTNSEAKNTSLKKSLEMRNIWRDIKSLGGYRTKLWVTNTYGEEGSCEKSRVVRMKSRFISFRQRAAIKRLQSPEEIWRKIYELGSSAMQKKEIFEDFINCTEDL